MSDRLKETDSTAPARSKGRTALLFLAGLTAVAGLVIAGFVIVSNTHRVTRVETNLTLGGPSPEEEWRGFRASMSRRIATLQRRIRAAREHWSAGDRRPEIDSLLTASEDLLDDLARATSGLDEVRHPDERAAARRELKRKYDVLRDFVKRATVSFGAGDSFDEDSLDAQLRQLLGD